MIWRLVSYPILILAMIVVSTLLEFAWLPIIAALRNHKSLALAAVGIKEVVGPIVSVFVAVTIAMNTRLVLPLAIVIITFVFYARNGLRRLNLAEKGASAPAVAAAAAGQFWDRSGEVRLEWLGLIALNVGFVAAVAVWWSSFEGVF